MMPLWLGRQKDSEQVFPAGLCVALTPHHQGFTSPIYLILFSPPTHAPLFMHYVKKKKKLRLLSLVFPHYLSPTPFLLPSNLLLLLLPPPPFLLYFFPSLSLLSSLSLSPLALHPAFTYSAHSELVCVRVCVNLSEISLFFVDWLPARTVKALPAARTWKMHRISLW